MALISGKKTLLSGVRDKKSTPSFLYILCILGAGITWGCTGMCNRFLTPLGYSQSQILFVRCVIPLVLIGVFLLLFRRGDFKIKLKDLWIFLGSGVASLTLFGLAYMNAMQEMSLATAATLLYTCPIFVTVLSAILFAERISGRKIIALVMVIVGAACTTGLAGGLLGFGDAPLVTSKGLLLGLLSGIGYALYSIFTRFAFNHGYSSNTVTFYTFLFSTIVVGAICDVGSMGQILQQAIAEGDFGHHVVWILAMGMGTAWIPYLLYTKGLEGVENGTASVLASVELVVATLISALGFGEAFGWTNGLGIIFVLTGIVAINTAGPRSATK